ncbi:preprotein translocase subunit YajC [Bifidobacterium sp.]|jgi:preprotein translocase subunit YajC|uniref:preprotein translocase subunit YajC n=1 Tax=Bifidobacterium sp. TaxID=41200 RepID=UPI0025B84407|nr:preprotein translocase subunit YajC [Bifidobacterium sp.]MCI1635739.1 preprotein translocase subunit YajC [Bifidobacterium sp.]
MEYGFMIVVIVFMVALMWWQSRKSKQQQSKVQDFRQSLQPGTLVATFSGLIGTVVSVDLDKDQIVIDSEGTQSRWRIQAITEPPVVPAYVSDDEVDEEGNPLVPSEETEQAQLPTQSASAQEPIDVQPVVDETSADQPSASK